MHEILLQVSKENEEKCKTSLDKAGGGGGRDKGVEWKYNQRHTKKEKKFELISQQN